MYFKVKTIDGELTTTINCSKLSKIKDIKLKIEEELLIKRDTFKCIYLGKILEDDYTLHDYKVKLNDTISIVVKNSENESTDKDNITEEKEINEEKVENKEQETEELEEGSSLYYKIGDAIDCCNQRYGSWYETIIQKIVKKKEEILYIVESNDIPVPERFIRPRARRLISFDKLFIGQKVMINYNLEEPKEIGMWYDFTISKINVKRTFQKLNGILHISSENQLEIKEIDTKEGIYAIETAKLLTERTPEDEILMSDTSKCKSVAPNCQSCKDNPNEDCKECGCNICAGKHDENELLLCDECDYAYHMTCLNPPLKVIPEDDWYCPECKNDENEIVKAGDKLKESKKKSVQENKKPKRDWGKGMACVGRQSICNVVSSEYRGKIPGIEVGTSWLYRIQVSESGVHRPHIAGIHGREGDCAYSLVLAGGYEDDVDDGDEFIYTGSGGRNLSGNKRTAAQSSDQTLTRMNKALALNCNAPLNDKDGATAKNWKGGIPVRVVRSSKLAKVSKYAPKEGNRYDGLYKVVKYFPATGKSGFRIWKYLLRRDDSDPAPWTKEGKKRIAQLGLKLNYPPGYLEAKKKADEKRKYPFDDEENAMASKENMSQPKKKMKLYKSYVLENKLKTLIESDEQNAKLWIECKKTLSDGKLAFLNCVSERFKCAFCLEMVRNPVTTPCSHNFCYKCLKNSFSMWQEKCPECRLNIDQFKLEVNKSLASALSLLYSQ